MGCVLTFLGYWQTLLLQIARFNSSLSRSGKWPFPELSSSVSWIWCQPQRVVNRVTKLRCWRVPWLTLQELPALCFGTAVTGRLQNYLPFLLQPLVILNSSITCLPSRIIQMTWHVEWKVKKETSSVIMELIIYGTFLLLSLIAYAARQVANKGEEKKVSVSNINFKRYFLWNFWRGIKNRLKQIRSSFQKSFFLVYFLALLGDWLQGPYVYKLYAFYGFKESQIAVLYVAGFASSVLFGTCTGPLADLWGRRKMVRIVKTFNMPIFHALHPLSFFRRLHFRSSTPFAAWPRWALTSGGWWLVASLEVVDPIWLIADRMGVFFVGWKQLKVKDWMLLLVEWWWRK